MAHVVFEAWERGLVGVECLQATSQSDAGRMRPAGHLFETPDIHASYKGDIYGWMSSGRNQLHRKTSLEQTLQNLG